MLFRRSALALRNSGFIVFTHFRLCSVKAVKATHRVNNLEKRFLVWTGKYKRIEDVPPLVTSDVMERARNRMRIRIANLMMVGTILGCIAMVISGKRARQRGESVEKQNLAWHQKIEEEQKKRE